MLHINIEDDDGLDDDESLLHVMNLEDKFLPVDDNLSGFNTCDNVKTPKTGSVSPSQLHKEIVINVSDDEKIEEEKSSNFIDLNNVESENDCVQTIEKVIDNYLEKNEGKKEQEKTV